MAAIIHGAPTPASIRRARGRVYWAVMPPSMTSSAPVI